MFGRIRAGSSLQSDGQLGETQDLAGLIQQAKETQSSQNHDEIFAAAADNLLPGMDQIGGSQHSQTPQDICAEATASCHEGTRLLRRGEANDALRILTRAQVLLDKVAEMNVSAMGQDRLDFAALNAEVASNLGICHRRLRELAPAVAQLQKALKFHKEAGSDLRTLVAAHLNLATCHLEWEAPAVALRYASAAVDLGGRLLAGPADQSGIASPQEGGENTDNDFAMLAVAFHKVAEAHEGLKEWGKATHAYTQAHEVVNRSLGPSHPLAKSLATSAQRGSYRAGSRPMSQQNQRLLASVAACQSGAGCIVRPGTHAFKNLLPGIPLSARGALAAKQMNQVNLTGYELGPDMFPSWPPRKATKEEKAWYTMAKECRKEVPLPMGSRQMQEPDADSFIIPMSRVRGKAT
eukprot:TRINITY_DN8645_c0_g3_i1.p1 TRINITY_DN8645_c0_g3~~TRINITY_DN8645_c0_g3_i1.p1  ORF type:complete len:408 (+),score=82.49 TRINITY_DN8645_c0_g3_i1:58-1281(+)